MPTQAGTHTRMQESVDLNNSAVRLLTETQDCCRAISMLSQSIRLLGQNLQGGSCNDDGLEQHEAVIHTTCQEESKETGPSSCCAPTTPVVQLVGFLEEGGDASQENYFNQAMVIDFKCHCGSYFHSMATTTKMDRTVVLSSILIYNCALACHHRAKYEVQASERNIYTRKAEKLYDTVIKQLSLLGDFKSYTMEQVAIVLQLASCNNLAQVRFQRGEDESARDCLARAHRSLSLVAASESSALALGDVHFSPSLLDDLCVQELMLRIFFLQTVATAGSAAAA